MVEDAMPFADGPPFATDPSSADGESDCNRGTVQAGWRGRESVAPSR